MLVCVESESTTIEGMAVSPALRDLRRLRDLLARRGSLILDAREAGHTWAEIAEASGMTRVGAAKSMDAELARREAEGRDDVAATPES